ncbi:MAG TPA: gliding motility lipoprotein GldD, partial [Flavobacteriaceae bacterium]|nr:gliding motility lipoprotein GldD [Flavobacteriaceae bacterium]
MRLILSLLAVVLLVSCQEEVLVKPKAKLRLDYTVQSYQKLSHTNCPFQFEVNRAANLTLKENCWMNLDYPNMKATIYLTYYQVEDNLKSLLHDAQ